jgi:hypothetical protein
MKPFLAVVAHVYIRATYLINDLPFFEPPKGSYAGVVAAHKIGLAFSLLCLPVTCNGTIILTAWSADKIIIAADGLSLQPDRAQPYKTSCKIRQADNGSNCFFAISGVQDDKDVSFDLVPLAHRACVGNGSLIERAERFKKVALPEVRREWRNIKRNNPNTYATMKRLGPARTAVVFASGTDWIVVIVQFVEDSTGEMVAMDSLVRTGNFATLPTFDMMGNYLGLEAYHREHPEVDRLDSTTFIRVLLIGALEREATDFKRENRIKTIGPPMAIVEIYARSAKWIEQGNCPDIKKVTPPSK